MGNTPDPRHWGFFPQTPGEGSEGRGREGKRTETEKGGEGKGKEGKGGEVCVIAVGGIDAREFTVTKC